MARMRSRSCGLAEAAAEIDDALAAETWHKAADAAARKLRDSPGPK